MLPAAIQMMAWIVMSLIPFSFADRLRSGQDISTKALT
jgi:hypothetical protein